MPLFIGYASATISILGWGSYFVPMKKVKEYNPIYFQAVMCVGIFISTIILSFFTHQFTFSLLAFLSGILWATGNVLSVFAVKHSRLAIVAPVWMGIGVVGSFLLGTLYFKEAVHMVILGILGIFLLLIGIILISKTGEEKGSSSIKGILFAVLAGLLFCSYLIPFKLSGMQPLSFLFPMSIGIVVAGFVIFFLSRPNIEQKIILPGILSSIIWNVANVSSFFAVTILGIAIGVPLTQMALFVSVLWGLIYFNEIKGKEKITRLIFAAILLFIGALLLSFSK